MSEELKELESGIDRLKRDSMTKKEVISALEREKNELLRRSEEISERLRKTNESYRESYRKLTDLVNSQVTGLKMEIAELSNGLKGISDLEQRLEAQEQSHEKTLKRLEKELVLVEKNLSDVERVKSEMASQRDFLQEAKLQLEKSLQAGIAYVRKEMEVNRREDAKTALEEFKQEIERITNIENELNTHKRSQSERLDRLTGELSSLKTVLAELRILKEKSSSLEELGKDLDSRLSNLTNKQKTASSILTSELSKQLENRMAKLKQEFEVRRSEDAKASLREFKQEIERIASLEGGLEENEKRLDGLSEELSGLKPFSDQITSLRDRVEQNLHMNRSLAERSVSDSDFERATKSISGRIEELEGRVFSLDKRVSRDKGKLEKEILDVINEEKILEGTQENIKQWFDAKFQDIDKKVSSGLDALTTQMEEGEALVDQLKTRSQRMDLMTREVPKKLEEHSKEITRLEDAKGGLATSLETLSGDLKTLSAGLTSSLERIASLEKGLSSIDKSKETRLDKLSVDFSSFQEALKDLSSGMATSLERIENLEKTLSSTDKNKESRLARLARDFSAYQQELKNLSVLVKDVSDSGKLDIANLRTELDSTLKNISKDLDGKVKDLAESGLDELRERTKGLASIRDLESELKVLKSGLSNIDSKNKNFAEVIIRELTDFKKSVDSRFSGLSEDQATQFKKEFDYIAKNIDSIRDLASDLKIFRSKLSDLERFHKTRVSEQDFGQFRDYIETRLAKTEELSGKSLDKLSKDLEAFKSNLESGKLSQSDFTKSMELFETKIEDLGVLAKSSTDELRKDLNSFKKSVADRINEVKGSQINEFKDELKRISQLENDIQTYARTHEERIDQLSESFSSLQALPSEIGMLREKIESLEKLSGSYVFSENFSQRLKETNSTLDQLQAGLVSLDKRIHKQEAGFDAAIREALGEDKLLKKSQEAMHKLIDERIAGVDKKISDSIRDLSEDFSKNSELVYKLRENVSEINRFSDLASENSTTLENLKERISALEKGFSLGDAEGARINELARAVEVMDTKLESSREEIKEFREYVIKHVNDVVNTYEKRFGELSKGLSGKQIGSLEKNLTEIENLKERVADLDKLARDLSNKSVPVSEFVETIRAVSKRVDDIEGLYSDMDKKTSVHEAQLDAAVRKALSDDKLIKASQEHIKEWLESRINNVEKRLSEDITTQTSQLSANLKDMSSMKEELVRLRSLAKHLDAETMSKVGERLDVFTKSKEGLEKRLNSLSGELKSMSDKFIEERGRVTELEQKLKSSIETQQASLKEMLKEQRLEVDTEISDEMEKIIKDAEIGELKRKHEFENLLRKFQELHIKTQQNLETISTQRESFMDMERKLKERINKLGADIQSKTTAGYDKLKERLTDAENLIMKLNNMISELQVRIDKKKDVKIDFSSQLSGIKEVLEERLKTNEDMFDSEMDAFKSRVDKLANELKVWSDVQKKGLGEIPPAERMQLETLNKSLSTLDNDLRSSKDEIKKFKDYITEYLSNLVNTYESRLGSIQKDMEYKIDDIKKTSSSQT
jgi:chromosome segregation ATPase